MFALVRIVWPHLEMTNHIHKSIGYLNFIKQHSSLSYYNYLAMAVWNGHQYSKLLSRKISKLTRLKNNWPRSFYSKARGGNSGLSFGGAHLLKISSLSWENIKQWRASQLYRSSGEGINTQSKKSKCWYKKVLDSTGDIGKSRDGLNVLTHGLTQKNPTKKE